MLNIGVMVSGGGTNLQAMIDAIESGGLPDCRIVTVISSNAAAGAIERAKQANILCRVISKKDFPDMDDYDHEILNHMKSCEVQLIVLAGFLSMIGKSLIKQYHGAIMNIHPSLIPSFCGKGFYGIIPHQKVIEHGVKVTGATVHFVDMEYDTGPIILQKAVCVLEEDTPESLQKRVMQEAEWKLLPEAIRLFSQGKLQMIGRRVHVQR